MVSNIYCIYDLNVTNLLFLSDSEPVSPKNLYLPLSSLIFELCVFFIYKKTINVVEYLHSFMIFSCKQNFLTSENNQPKFSAVTNLALISGG